MGVPCRQSEESDKQGPPVRKIRNDLDLGIWACRLRTLVALPLGFAKRSYCRHIEHDGQHENSVDEKMVAERISGPKTVFDGRRFRFDPNRCSPVWQECPIAMPTTMQAVIKPALCVERERG